MLYALKTKITPEYAIEMRAANVNPAADSRPMPSSGSTKFRSAVAIVPTKTLKCSHFYVGGVKSSW
jgi:hypothetical protein